RWRVGGPEGPVLEVASVRTPCVDFKSWMGRSGYDDRSWVKRFAAEGRPGPYLRVLVPGRIGAGDELEVVHRPGHGVTVSLMFRALHGHPDLLPRLLEVERLTAKARVKVDEYVAATANETLGVATGARLPERNHVN
ncbi:MAG: MOSC domain-containing protein, partial [Nocardioides sp.]